MAKLNEIIANIKNLRAGGVQNRDIKLSDRNYAFIIGYYRALLLRREIEQGRRAKGNWIQNLGQVSFIKADRNECCDIEDCIVRSEFQIPSPIEIYESDLITYVGTTDGNIPFQRTTYNRALWDKYNPYTGKLPKWYIQNNYIYIINPPTSVFEIGNIQGIFDDPIRAIEFNTCDCNPDSNECLDVLNFNFDYPIPTYLLDSLYKMMIDAEIKFSTILPPDNLNNSQDAPSQ
jgi:hypothetical protein